MAGLCSEMVSREGELLLPWEVCLMFEAEFCLVDLGLLFAGLKLILMFRPKSNPSKRHYFTFLCCFYLIYLIR